MNLKIHAYNLETVIVRCLQLLLSRLRSRQTINILSQRSYNFCYRANFLSKVSMNLKIHAYNLETVIVRCNGATIFVIALKI